MVGSLSLIFISLLQFMCNGIRNSPIDIDFDTSSGMWTEQQEGAAFASPLKFKGYSSVRADVIGNSEEHIGSLKDDTRANKLSNKGGHTAVSTVGEGLFSNILKILAN